MTDRTTADGEGIDDRTSGSPRRSVLAGLGLVGLGTGFAGLGGARSVSDLIGTTAAQMDDESEFVSLFDGESIEDSYWHRVNGQANYYVEDGAIVGESVLESPNSFLTHYKVFDDFEVRMEVKLDQALNSGIQVRSNVSQMNPEVHGPQVEIELSGEDTQQFPPAEAGYVYGESLGTGWLSQERPPHDAFDNDDWNDYRILVEGDTISTWINGQLIEDSLDLSQYDDVPHLIPMGVLGLQVHSVDEAGRTVRWRNIRINELDEGEWTSLFDGQDTEGWTTLSGEGDATVSDGVLELSGDESFSLRTGQTYDDFVFETWVKAGTEGGILFRNPGEDAADGYRVDVDPTDSMMTGSLYDIDSENYLADISNEDVSGMAFHPDQWNYVRVLANDGVIRVWVNGITTAWLTDDAHSSGYIGLQHLGGDGTLQFRDMRVNPLDEDESPVGPPPQVVPYQVDFARGEPIEELGGDEDDFYGRQDRLIQYVHGDDDGVTKRDSWINSLDSETRECVDAEPIQVDDDTASVTFTVAEGCELTLSLVSYTLPGGDFTFDTANEQELVDDESETFGPGEHTLEVDLPIGTPEE